MYQIEMWSAHYEIPFVGLIFRKIAVNKMALRGNRWVNETA
jgi:hypothetical protein